MDGVTILNTVEKTVQVAGEFNAAAAGTALIISIIVVALIGFAIGYNEREVILGLILGALFGLVLGIFIGAIFGSIFAEPPMIETTTQYEVTLDDSVSMNEFTEHYKIIEQRGKIFVVEEKTNK